MIRLHQQLEKLFGSRFNSNSDIIEVLKKLSEAGKFDEPKKVAVFAIILDRLGQAEDEEINNKSLEDFTITTHPQVKTDESQPDITVSTLPTDQPATDNQPASQIEAPSSASSDVPATPETPETTPTEPVTETPPETTPETPVVDTATPPETGTISALTPDAIANGTDPTPDSTTP